MSLNKFTDTSKGYALGLDVGADELKCNTIEVVNSITAPNVVLTDGSQGLTQKVPAVSVVLATDKRNQSGVVPGGQLTTFNADTHGQAFVLTTTVSTDGLTCQGIKWTDTNNTSQAPTFDVYVSNATVIFEHDSGVLPAGTYPILCPNAIDYALIDNNTGQVGSWVRLFLDLDAGYWRLLTVLA